VTVVADSGRSAAITGASGATTASLRSQERPPAQHRRDRGRLPAAAGRRVQLTSPTADIQAILHALGIGLTSPVLGV